MWTGDSPFIFGCPRKRLCCWLFSPCCRSILSCFMRFWRQKYKHISKRPNYLCYKCSEKWMMIHFWMYGSSIIKVLQQIKKTSPYDVTCLMTGRWGEGLKGDPSLPLPKGITTLPSSIRLLCLLLNFLNGIRHCVLFYAWPFLQHFRDSSVFLSGICLLISITISLYEMLKCTHVFYWKIRLYLGWS